MGSLWSSPGDKLCAARDILCLDVCVAVCQLLPLSLQGSLVDSVHSHRCGHEWCIVPITTHSTDMIKINFTFHC